jgi:plasmid stabilization system protein ParE
MTIRYRAQALTDIDEIFLYIQERNPVGAQNVLRAIYAGIHLIGERPLACELTDDPSVRVKVVRRYHYKIFFQIVGDGAVEILHIRHTSRRPWEI